jgi:hypothetical protein
MKLPTWNSTPVIAARFVVLALASACLPAQALQRAFVSSTGSDANAATNCLLSAPCRSFQAAHGVVDDGGEIVALDAAGYAPVTITKSVTIIGNPGFVAGISVPVDNGVHIAAAGVHVVLRNLSIIGGGGYTGVALTAGASLTIENCVISNLVEGIYVPANAKVRIVDSVMRGNTYGAVFGGATLDIVNSQFIGNAACGLSLDRLTAGTMNATVSDSVASGNDVGVCVRAAVPAAVVRAAITRTTAANNTIAGIRNGTGNAAASSTVTVGASTVTGNAVGFYNLPFSGISAFESLGDNIVQQNTSPSSGTITYVPGR